jgi:SAM-dependent methyltransferase
MPVLRNLITSRVVTPLKRKARSYLLRGSQVKCLLCRGQFVTFLPFGQPPRANALCPRCGSLERTRLYWKYLQSKSDFFRKPKRVLHVAPERILFEKFSAAANLTYVPVDKFESGYRYPAGTRNVDVTDMRFPDDYFDFVLCSHVLEHVPDDRKAMRELFRVLKPNGFAILQVPWDRNRESTYEDLTITDPHERVKAFGQQDHVRIYGRDYVKRLEDAGFRVAIERPADELSPLQRFRYGFRESEVLFVGHKPPRCVADTAQSEQC